MPSRRILRLADCVWLFRAWALRRWWQRIVFALRQNSLSAPTGLSRVGWARPTKTVAWMQTGRTAQRTRHAG